MIINPWQFNKCGDFNKLNRTGYINILENGFIRLKKNYWKWSTITIPFVIRSALNDSIGSKITSDLKIGASMSYNINWDTFKNRRIKAKKSSLGISFGLGFGFSKIVLDNDSTSLDDSPLTDAEDGLGLFISPGIGLNIKGLQLVGFVGYDIGLTQNTKKWNYKGKPFIGIGLGLDLATLGSL